MTEPLESDTFLLAQVEQIGNAIAQTFGEAFCEVLIHDFRQPEHSIIWIRGQLTQRHLGGAMSQIGLEMMAQGDEAKAKMNYITRTRDGKILKSSIIPLRDAHGHVFGAFCIKLDITSLVALEQNLQSFLAPQEEPAIKNVFFSDSISEVAQSMIDEAMQQLGLTVPPTDTRGRIELVSALKQRGFFGIRRSINLLADYLKVSRASIYNHLKEVSQERDLIVSHDLERPERPDFLEDHFNIP